MAIIENRVTEIGDVLYIKVETPIIGLSILTDYVDNLGGVTLTRYFDKFFRYSRDGVIYTEWIVLNNTNLNTININPTDTFIIEYKYQRAGTDVTGDLSFSNITLHADQNDLTCGITYQDSIFSQFFSCSDIEILLWSINVLEKTYKRGVLPDFIERGKEPSTDTDFIVFWRSITTFFAYIVVYARKFQNYSLNKDLLLDNLRQRGLFIQQDASLQDLVELKKHFYKEFSKRGTLSMIKDKGEVLRLVEKTRDDEFIFALIDTRSRGWCLNNSSPLWRGNNPQRFLSKAWSSNGDFNSLTEIPTIGTVSLINDTVEGDKQVLKINGNSDFEKNGFGCNPAQPNLIDFSKTKNISPEFSYKITFQVRQLNQNETFTFGVLCFDKNNNIISNSSIINGSQTNYFFRKIKLNKTDRYFQIKGILYFSGSNFLSVEDGVNSIGYGSDLTFGSNEVVKILPFILVENDSSGIDSSVYIWDLKITPNDCLESSGVIGGSDLVKVFYKNNSSQFNNVEIKRLLKRYFLPYSSRLNINEVTDAKFPNPLVSFDFAVIRYIWNGEGGKDLDTRTAFINTSPVINNQDLGWSRGATLGTGPTGNYYMEFGGDFTGDTGEEAILINFDSVKRDFPSLEKAYIRLRANWYQTRFGGNIILQFCAYKGGSMQKVGTNFINVGGIEVVNQVKLTNVISNTIGNVDGSDCGQLNYDFRTKTAILI